MHFLMIECRSDAIDLPIFVIYDVQHVDNFHLFKKV